MTTNETATTTTTTTLDVGIYGHEYATLFEYWRNVQTLQSEAYAAFDACRHAKEQLDTRATERTTLFDFRQCEEDAAAVKELRRAATHLAEVRAEYYEVEKGYKDRLRYFMRKYEERPPWAMDEVL